MGLGGLGRFTTWPGLQALSRAAGPQTPESVPQDQVPQVLWRGCCRWGGAPWSCPVAPGMKAQ